MTNDAIGLAQQYLTIDRYRIMDIETLLKSHSLQRILSLLETMMKEKKAEVADLVSLQITGAVLNRCIVEWFRLQFAINVLQEEVTYEASDLKQRAEGSRNAA